MKSDDLIKKIEEIFPRKKPRESILVDLNNICTSLEISGKPITVRNVRDVWGQGSFSTITKYLKLRKVLHAEKAKKFYRDFLDSDSLKEKFAYEREKKKDFNLSAEEAMKLYFSDEKDDETFLNCGFEE